MTETIYRCHNVDFTPTPKHILEKNRDYWLNMIKANPTGMVEWWAAAAAGIQATIDREYGSGEKQ